MTVSELWTSGIDYRVGGRGYEAFGKLESIGNGHETTFAEELLRVAALCSDAHLIEQQHPRSHFKVIGDPTEVAILVAAAKAGISQDALKNWPRLAELPFDSAQTHDYRSTAHTVCKLLIPPLQKLHSRQKNS